MTAYELITQTFANLNITPTNELRAQYNAILLDGLNKGYQDVSARFLRPITGEEITLDANKGVDLTTLSKTVKGINFVSQYQAGTADAHYNHARQYRWLIKDDGITLVVPDAQSEATLWINYEYIPAALVNPAPTSGVGATSPDPFFPAQYQYVLAYKATAAYWRAIRNYERVDEWENAYFSELPKITPANTYQPVTVVDAYGGMML